MSTTEDHTGASEMAEQGLHPPWSSGGNAIATSAKKLAEPDRDDVPNLDRVERLPDA